MLGRLQELRSKYGLRRGLKRELSLWKNRYLFPSTVSTVHRELQQLGIRRGDLVLVHSAFSKIGYLKNGTSAFLSALRMAVGPEGTLMMPSFPFNDPALEYAGKGIVFDVRRTPSTIGQLQEDFRLLPGTLRSLHPTHPYCANGPLAAELIKGHHLQRNPFTRDTPLFRFVEMKGKCLLVGVGLKNCSPFRVIEEPDTYPYEVFHPTTITLPVVDENGARFEVETLVHSGTLAPERRNEVFRAPLERRGMLTRGKIGLADALLVNCDGLMKMMEQMLAEGLTPYSHLPRPIKPI